MFSKTPAVAAYNTYIGGVSSSIGTASALATKLGISVGTISNFVVEGADIKCKITGSYSIQGGAFLNNSFYFDDITLYNNAPTPCTAGSTGNPPGETDYALVWADEFSEDGPPCFENWGYDIGAGGWGNGEAQYYTSSINNAFVLNGVLTIKAIKENFNGT